MSNVGDGRPYFVVVEDHRRKMQGLLLKEFLDPVIKSQDIGRQRENEEMLCGIYPVWRRKAQNDKPMVQNEKRNRGWQVKETEQKTAGAYCNTPLINTEDAGLLYCVKQMIRLL